MPSYRYVTADVFTSQPFGGNPLAVVTDARGLSDAQMQQLAAEFNYSESTFVLPADDAANTARVRIFNRTHEMPFAGHPNVGTAVVLATLNPALPALLRFEEVAGLVEITVERNPAGDVTGAMIVAPAPLSTGITLSATAVATCLGIAPGDIDVRVHQPIVAAVGMPFVLVQVSDAARAFATPHLEAFRRLVGELSGLNGRLSIFFYSHDGGRQIRARMFAPLAGTWEDPATGSASAALVALLLSHRSEATLSVDIVQGVEMGRPSHISARAWRTADGIRSSVSGASVIVCRGEVSV
jgi:trans-2,3-dihydro-3-hydroxyanthranilate isomerase